MKNITERQVRNLRDKIYGVPISDKEWNTCKDNWIREENIKWLIEHQPNYK